MEKIKYLSLPIIFIVTISIYFNSLKNNFTSEDYLLIVNNKFIYDFKNYKLLFSKDNFLHPIPVKSGARPLTLFSLLIDFKFWKLNPFGYHLTNLILHSINSILVYFTFTMCNINPALSLISSLIFSSHPLQTETVNVPGFRGNLLVTSFILISLILMVKIIRDKKLFLIFPLIITYIFSLLIKEIGIVIALLFPMLLFILNPHKIKTNLTILFVFFVIGFLYITEFFQPRFRYDIFSVIFVNLTGKIKPFTSIISYLDTISKTFLHYVTTILYPFNLSFDYQLSLSNKITPVLILGIILIISSIYIFLKIKDTTIKLGIGIFLVSYLPVSNLIPLYNVYADRYLYIPFIGISLLLGKLLIYLSKKIKLKPMMRYAIPLLILFIYAKTTLSRNLIFKNMLTLYEDTVKKSPKNPRVRFHLALAYMKNRMWTESIEELKTTISLNPIYKRFKIWQLLGENYQLLGDYITAEKYYLKLILANSNVNVLYHITFQHNLTEYINRI